MTRTTLAVLMWLSLAAPLQAAGAAPSPEPADPEQVARLAEAGAMELALALIDAHQPAPPEAADWIDWERLRLTLLQRQERWRELVARAEALPASAPAAFRRWADARRAEAELASGRADAARAVLVGLIWGDAIADSAELARWRRSLIQAYLAADANADAYTALLRYEQDYAPDDADWKRLRARVLLAVERPQEARASLGSDPAPEARPLYLLAAMRSGAMTPAAVRKEAERAALTKGVGAAVRAELWVAAAEAARLSGDPEGELGHLAQAVASGAPAGSLLQADSSRLW
ncbi:MAG TPA: hypothetical protein ENO23_07030, partial [Alphaproteobacteria bacterium]|nr:hypothetical protein [Alphaproteobacteria bacterium]